MTLYSPPGLSLPPAPPLMPLPRPPIIVRDDLYVPGTDPLHTPTPREDTVSPKLDRQLLYDPPELQQYEPIPRYKEVQTWPIQQRNP